MSGKLKAKLRLIYKILTGEYRHLIYINIDEADFVRIVKHTFLDTELCIETPDIGYFGMREVQLLTILKSVGEAIPEGDIIAAGIENKINYDLIKGKDLTS